MLKTSWGRVIATWTVILLVFAVVYEAKRPPWLRPGFADTPLLLAYRDFEGRVQSDRLSVHGGVVTFLDRDTTESFVAYNFAYSDLGFTSMLPPGPVGALHARYGLRLPTRSTVIADSCIDPRPGTTTTGRGVALIRPTLCRIAPSRAGAPMGVIGVLFPSEPGTRDGNAMCRKEARHWHALEGFGDAGVVICIVVDRPPEPKARKAEDWMDVIAYQQIGDALLTMRASRRNFTSIY